MRLTQKQINFALDVVKQIPAGKAYMAHYKVRTMAVADAAASRLLKTVRVQAYLKELRQKMEDESIADPIERKQILTQIVRAAIPDFVTEDKITVTAESPNVKAVAEITQREGKHGLLPVVITNIKLHNPMQAIDLLNKMDKIYEVGASVTVDNRTVNIIVESERGKELTERLLRGDESLGDEVHSDL